MGTHTQADDQTSGFKRLPNWLQRPEILALLAVLLVLATEQLIEHYVRASDQEQERLAVLDSLSAARSRL